MDCKDRARERIEAATDDLIALSHRIHAHPEVLFEEFRASRWTADLLAANGFDVTAGTAGLDTAFVAEAGVGPLTVAVCAEYDALPGVGHACGHNVIAAAGVGAGLGLAAVADELGLTVRVLGTPAEEGGGAKITMMEAGAFDGVHAALMIHPAPHELLRLEALAVQHFHVTYRGQGAHAAMHPELGVNAADALTVAQVALGLLRQHLAPADKVHGIVTHGGDAPNVVPDRAEGTWFVRAATLDELAELKPRVYRCFEAGALATGCEVAFDEPAPAYSQLVSDPELERLYAANLEAVGRRVDAGERMVASTDMANVSLVIPTIHPMIAIDAGGASNHQAEFAAACAGPSADRAVRDGALLLAWTAIDAAADEAQRTRLLARAYRADRDGVPRLPGD